MPIDDHSFDAFSNGVAASGCPKDAFQDSGIRDRGFPFGKRVSSWNYPMGFGATPQPGGVSGFFTIQDYECVLVPDIKGGPFWNPSSPDSPVGLPADDYSPNEETQPDQVAGRYNCEITPTAGVTTVNPWQLDGGVTAGWTNNTEGASAFFFQGGASFTTKWKDLIEPGKYDITLANPATTNTSGTVNIFIVGAYGGVSAMITSIDLSTSFSTAGNAFTIDSIALLGSAVPFTITIDQNSMAGFWSGLTWFNTPNPYPPGVVGLPPYGTDWSVSTGNMAIQSLTNVPGWAGNISGVPH